ncbi:hypothetical protein [Candidatus Bathycorpusculum sp.]|uniref:hypothetical protein n=1 Tax=Candidatus Bathycorpusculum sp. TaxID=2994959 RepID=UPI00283A12C2|nr:hypothetical protein [Candidatus Termitimicrobium sp.]
MPQKKPVRKVRARTTKKPEPIRMTEEEVIAAYYRAHPHLTPPETPPEKKKTKEKPPQKPKTKPIPAAKLDANNQPLPADAWPLSKVIGAVFTSVMIGLSIAIIILSFVR